jgi:muramidase (phage lysozyme)
VKWTYVLPPLAALVLLVLLVRRASAGQGVPDALPDFPSIDEVYVPESLDTSADQVTDAASRNVSAFLDTIKYAEGTWGKGDNILFGFGTFDGFDDHPRIRVPFRDTFSTAAGPFQIIAPTWDRIASRLGLPDFSPASQEQAAIELIREAGALDDVEAGRFAMAVEKVRKVWASFPGAGYGQPERSFQSLAGFFQAAGGTLAG